MAAEIERKYLVDRARWKASKRSIHSSHTITQGYLSKASTHNVRIRILDNSAVITIKGKKQGITRPEFEYSIPVKDAKVLLQMCDQPLTHKIRHYIQIGAHLWSVDEFKGLNKGLLLAEVELGKETEKFVAPDWILDEVTHDRRYSNTYLSTHKIPQR